MPTEPASNGIVYATSDVYTDSVKRLVDIDDDALADAQAVLGTRTIKETVNTALLLASAAKSQRTAQIDEAFATLAQVRLSDDERRAAWY